MTVGRNSERKKIDQVLEAFAKFLNTRKNDRHKFKLYVHTNHIESCTGTDLVAQMMSLNIVDNTFCLIHLKDYLIYQIALHNIKILPFTSNP
jgi:glycosyltransferase involved in cell wall biosynthesis